MMGVVGEIAVEELLGLRLQLLQVRQFLARRWLIDVLATAGGASDEDRLWRKAPGLIAGGGAGARRRRG